jgi:hypothetical protein
VEECRSLDVNRLHREGCLRLGWSDAWQWTRDGRTYERVHRRTFKIEMPVEEAIDLHLVKLAARIDGRNSKGSFWK